LRAEDLIVGIDDLEVRREASLETFGEYVQSRKPRTDVTLHVLRNGKPTDVAVNLMRRPADLEDRAFLWGGESYVPPAQAEVEEQEFREWLRQKRDQEKQSE
jgi:C-terminal processing protease CtpA/Prc